MLLPSLQPGQVVVLDNLGAHKPDRMRALVEAAGCRLGFLPVYSPDSSPIEEAFSKIKTLGKAAAARTRAALDAAIAAALAAVTAADLPAGSPTPDTPLPKLPEKRCQSLTGRVFDDQRDTTALRTHTEVLPLAGRVDRRGPRRPGPTWATKASGQR
ncbi:transposase [Geodermatophilus sp. URMC 65]